MKGLQPRTLEILQTLRLKRLLEEQGSRVRETASWSNLDGRISQESIEPWTDPTAFFPYDLLLDEGSLEACFEKHLSSHGLAVSRSLEVVQLQYHAEYDPPYVLAYIKSHVTGCIETWRTQFVIGSDGYNSGVRRLSGISHFGPETKIDWMTATVDAFTDFPDHRRRAYIWSQQKCLIMMPGKPGVYHLRILLSAEDVRKLNESALDNARIASSSSIATSEAMIDILERSLRLMLAPYQFTIRQILFVGLNSTFKQVASQFVDRYRCTFLLGESSHTHSLWADHQVNAGIADAWNLTWKLALVCKGKSTRSILSTYGMEQQSLALSRGRSLETDFNPDGGDHFQFQEKQALIAAQQYAPNVLIKEEVRNNIKKNRIAPGKILTPFIVTRHSSGDEISLLDEFPTSGKFHLLIMAGNILSQPILISLCSYLSKTSVLWSLDEDGMAGGDKSAISDYAGVSGEVYLIHSSSHLDISLANLPSPFTGSDRVYEDVSGKAHESMGISKNLGALVLLRPDLVVSIVSNLDDAPSCSKLLRALSEE